MASIIEVVLDDSTYNIEYEVVEDEVQEEPCRNITEEPSQTPAKATLSDTDRMRIIEAHVGGQKPKVIARIMDIPQRTIEHFLRQYAKTGRVKTSAGRDRPVSRHSAVFKSRSSNSFTPSRTQQKPTIPIPKPKISDEQKDFLWTWANEDASLTAVQLTRKLNEYFHTDFPLATVQRSLPEFTFSIHRISTPPEINNEPSTVALRKEFCQIFRDIPTIYSDSAVVYLGHMRFRLSSRDRRMEKSQDNLRHREMSICVAMSNSEVLGFIGQNEPLNKETIERFTRTLIELQRVRGIPSGVFIMDESFALDDSIDDLNSLVQEHDYSIIVLPPHSPFLDPTEGIFRELRGLIKTLEIPPNDESSLVDLLINNDQRLSTAIHCRKYCDEVMEFID